MTERSAIDEQEQGQMARRLRKMHEDFRLLYAPEDIYERSRFEADLAMLMHEVAAEALRPFQDAAAHAISMRLPLGTVIKDFK